MNYALQSTLTSGESKYQGNKEQNTVKQCTDRTGLLVNIFLLIDVHVWPRSTGSIKLHLLYMCISRHLYCILFDARLNGLLTYVIRLGPYVSYNVAMAVKVDSEDGEWKKKLDSSTG